MPDKTKIIAIVGPTASGKSALAVRLARQFNGEIISVDSRQVYRGLDIGSGKLKIGDRKGVKHYLLDVASLKRLAIGEFTAAHYKKLAERATVDIMNRGKLPIFCGGTGFYLAAVLGVVTLPPVPPNRALRARLEKLSAEELLTKLKILNPARAAKIDSKNRRRLIRAIEVARAKNGKDSPFRDFKDCPLKFCEILKIGILVEKGKLRQRINQRLASEFQSGLLAEVKGLQQRGLPWRRLDDLGLEYRFVSRYLRQQLTKNEMIQQLQTAIWHYAKRQLTWFKRDKEIVWVKTPTAAERLTRDFLKKSDKVE